MLLLLAVFQYMYTTNGQCRYNCYCLDALMACQSVTMCTHLMDSSDLTATVLMLLWLAGL
jgi:hypothetical protein